MSCIAGILNLDGQAVDPDLMWRMTKIMSPRAPDAQDIFVRGSVGLGHALLRTSEESRREHQPFTLDGNVWICADARIDARKDLISTLRSLGAQLKPNASDPELILHAYLAIGNNFVDHLVGDFAFALWDEHARRLICARDHFGVRPFFYVRTRDHFLFASHINALRLHPLVSSELDEGYIADLLLFGDCLDTAASAFSSIRRLPCSTMITLEHDRIETRKYWKLPECHELAKASDSECLEKFSEIFEQAVHDRMGVDGTAIELSGGMDSGAVAAMMCAQGHTVSRKFSACSVSCLQLFEDDEDAFTKLTAATLGMELVFQQLAEYQLFQNPDLYMLSDEPHANPNFAVHFDKWSRISAQGTRVVLSGQGGDAAFAATPANPSRRYEVGALFELVGKVMQHFIRYGTVRGAGIRAHFGMAQPGQAWRPPVPVWINPDFARRTDIFDRWESGWQRIHSATGVHRQLNTGILSSLFEAYERPNLALSARHPFFDIRLVCFMMSVPGWLKADKGLLRKAMSGRLPSEVLGRPKASLAGDVVRSQVMKMHDRSIFKDMLASTSAAYVSEVQYALAFDQYVGGDDPDSTWISTSIATPLCLALWLKGLRA